jgi:hypothetical protein
VLVSYQSECPQDLAAQYAGLLCQTSRAQRLARNYEETSSSSNTLQVIINRNALEYNLCKFEEGESRTYHKELQGGRSSKLCSTHQQPTQYGTVRYGIAYCRRDQFELTNNPSFIV